MVVNVLNLINEAKKFKHIDKICYYPSIGETVETDRAISPVTMSWVQFDKPKTAKVIGYSYTIKSLIEHDKNKKLPYIRVKYEDDTDGVLLVDSCRKTPEYKW